MAIDKQTLADLILATAETDTTSPGPNGFGWVTNELIGRIDAFVVVKLGDPSVYIDIGQRVYAETNNVMPEVAVLALLMILRGKRRLPVTPERESHILYLIKHIRSAILELPGSARRGRCESLLLYHSGIFYQAYGHYNLAADTHRQAAEKAEQFGDKAGASISRLEETFNRLKYATVLGRSDEFNARFSNLENACDRLVESLKESSLETQWVGNAYMYMLEACFLLKRNDPRWDFWAKSVAAAAKLGEAWKDVPSRIQKMESAKRDW